jgi:hypothetical protein
MDHLYESATLELQDELGDKNYKVVWDDHAREYQVMQFISGEGWTLSASYRQWGAKQIREYKMYYYESHEGRIDHNVWRERRKKERDFNRINDDIEASQIACETAVESFKMLRDAHAVKQGVW